MTAESNAHSFVLMLGDDREVLEYLELALSCEGCRVNKAINCLEAIEVLREQPDSVQALVIDLLTLSQDGFLAMRALRSVSSDVPIFAVSAIATQSQVLEAKRAGVTGVFAKPLRSEDLRTIARAARSFPSSSWNSESDGDGGLQVFLGNGPGMREVRSIMRTAGPSALPVVIRGETGVGKEVVARELHRLSPRANRPFVKLNCAALPAELIESELFGYERGAFTGAFQRKQGLFELADTGTILLDEIGDMDVKLQAKLLQVLQDKEFKRLGGVESIRVDVRVLAATHKDLEKAIEDNSFREDLYYRLNVVSISLPPLRERGEDIIRLAELLMKRHAPAGTQRPSLTAGLRQAMIEHAWPGNVRELENLMQWYLVFKDPEIVTRELRAKKRGRVSQFTLAGGPPAPVVEQLPSTVRAIDVVPRNGDRVRSSMLEEVTRAKEQAESRAILQALDATRWNRKRAANMLNIDYKALLYRMKKLSLDQSARSAAVS